MERAVVFSGCYMADTGLFACCLDLDWLCRESSGLGLEILLDLLNDRGPYPG